MTGRGYLPRILRGVAVASLLYPLVVQVVLMAVGGYYSWHPWLSTCPLLPLHIFAAAFLQGGDYTGGLLMLLAAVLPIVGVLYRGEQYKVHFRLVCYIPAVLSLISSVLYLFSDSSSWVGFSVGLTCLVLGLVIAADLCEKRESAALPRRDEGENQTAEALEQCGNPAMLRVKLVFSLSLTALISLCIVVLILVQLWFLGEFRPYETNDVEDYLNIVGNYDNDTPKEFILSFFPAELDASFTDVTYHYKAIKGDTYAYEAYLEFIITDKAAYETFVASAVDRDACEVFAYDASYSEYTVRHEYEIWKSHFKEDENSDDPYVLETAKVGKILFSDEEQRLIFVAIGMYDGGGAHTMELGYFLKKFNIPPTEFATRIEVALTPLGLAQQEKEQSATA